MRNIGPASRLRSGEADGSIGDDDPSPTHPGRRSRPGVAAVCRVLGETHRGRAAARPGARGRRTAVIPSERDARRGAERNGVAIDVLVHVFQIAPIGEQVVGVEID